MSADLIAEQEAALLAALEEQYRIEEEAILEEQMRIEEELFREEMALMGETDPNVIAELQAERQAARLKDIVQQNKKKIADKKKKYASSPPWGRSCPLAFAPLCFRWSQRC